MGSPNAESAVVASSSDLVFGSRIPVNDPEVTELSYQGQQIGPAEVTLIAAATSTLAALTEIDVRQNPGIDEASLAALRAAAEETGCTILADDDLTDDLRRTELRALLSVSQETGT